MKRHVYYRGDKDRGNDIKKVFKLLGAKDLKNIFCTSPDYHYFINKYDMIESTPIDSEEDKLLQKLYDEAFIEDDIEKLIKEREKEIELAELILNQANKRWERLFDRYKP